MSSNSDSFREVAGFGKETKEEAEAMNKCRELMTKVESSFSALVNAIMAKLGQQLSDIFKDSLECAICKELIIKAVSQSCTHMFCYLCFTTWQKQSKNCPICRDDNCVCVKNTLIDGVVQLLADLSLTEEEKKKRINITQQRSTSSPEDGEEILIAVKKDRTFLEPISDSDFVFIGRFMSVAQAAYFISEITEREEFQKQLRDAKEEDRTDIKFFLDTFKSDILHWNSILYSFPDSLTRRFHVLY